MSDSMKNNEGKAKLIIQNQVELVYKCKSEILPNIVWDLVSL